MTFNGGLWFEVVSFRGEGDVDDNFQNGSGGAFCAN
jgi:hypothetical protein